MYMGPSLGYYFQWIYLLDWIAIILLRGHFFPFTIQVVWN